MADTWVTRVAVVYDSRDTGTYEPANAYIVDTSTDLHTLVVGTTGHNMPNRAIKEAYTGEGHEENFRWLEARGVPDGGEKSGRI